MKDSVQDDLALSDDCYGRPVDWIHMIDPSTVYYDRESLTAWSGQFIKELMVEYKRGLNENN